MTRPPQKPARAARSSKTPPASLSTAAAMARVLQAFTLMPFHSLAEGRNQSMRSLFQELTGLSKSRIAKGNLDAIRPSTQKKIEAYQQCWMEEHFKDDPEAFARAREQVATSPRTRSGANAPLAGWVHWFEHLPDCPLPISKAVALVADDLVEELLTACQADDLAAVKQTVLQHFEHHGQAARIGDEPLAMPPPEAELAAWQSMENWEQAEKLTRTLVEHLYLDLICAFDAEWSSEYFLGRQCLPLFPLVMVRPQDGLLETKKIASRKNVIYRPSRRLLEFLYALVFHIRRKRWPANSPSPKALAAALGMDTVMVNNYFDGSRKLTLDLAYDYWVHLYQHFLPDKKVGERVVPPFPMIMLALHWQTLLVQDNGKTFILLDQEKYNTLWPYRRRQWEVQQAERYKDRSKAGHPKPEPIEWPGWMKVNQSSSSA